MSYGVYPQDQPCAFCHRPVNELDATWYEGKPFHEHHFKLYLANELSNYEKRKTLGQLTIAEAARMQEFQELYDIERRSKPSPRISKHINPEVPCFHGNTKLALFSLENSNGKAKLVNGEHYKELPNSDNNKVIEIKGYISDGKAQNSQTPLTPQK